MQDQVDAMDAGRGVVECVPHDHQRALHGVVRVLEGGRWVSEEGGEIRQATNMGMPGVVVDAVLEAGQVEECHGHQYDGLSESGLYAQKSARRNSPNKGARADSRSWSLRTTQVMACKRLASWDL